MSSQVINIISNQKFTSKCNDEMQIIIDILSLYNCRISEILNLRKQDFHRNKFVTLHGLKKSNDIILRDRSIVASLIKLASMRSDNIFVFTSYKKVYNFIKKNYSHLINSVTTKHNLKVTHLFRYLATETFNNDDEIKVLLHHNSKKSNHFYINKSKG